MSAQSKKEIELAPGVRLVLDDETAHVIHSKAMLPPGRYYATITCSFSGVGYPLPTIESEARLRILISPDDTSQA